METKINNLAKQHLDPIYASIFENKALSSKQISKLRKSKYIRAIGKHIQDRNEDRSAHLIPSEVCLSHLS